MSYTNIPLVVLANTFNDWVASHNVMVNVVNTLMNGSPTIYSNINLNGSLSANLINAASITANSISINGSNVASDIANAATTATVSADGSSVVSGRTINFVSTPTVAVSVISGINAANVGFSITSSAQGPQGTTGSPGTPGSNGLPGAQGTAGAQGAAGGGGGGSGAQGAQGITGTGTQGAQGISGASASGAPLLRMVTAGYTGGGQVFVANSATGTPVASAQGDVWIDINGGQQFQQSLVTNGYTTLPNGLTFLWGYVASATQGSTGSVVFSTAFTTATLNISLTPVSTLTTIVQTAQENGFVVVSSSRTGFSYYMSSGSNNQGFYWFAIGY
jgi:hypothetical protein